MKHFSRSLEKHPIHAPAKSLPTPDERRLPSFQAREDVNRLVSVTLPLEVAHWHVKVI
jgi:hypothetical protein